MCTSNCSICGADCTQCPFRNNCGGCIATDGHPFGEKCLVAAYCQKGENAYSLLKKQLISAFNALNIPNMQPVTELHPLPGSFINLRYPLPNGQTARLWDDRKIYLGNQLCKYNSSRCYGLAADDHYLMVSEYGELGSDPEIIVFKRWN